MAAESLRRLGVPADKLQVVWREAAEPSAIDAADGLGEASRRRVDIDVRL
jgi:outer membrane protein OmpA-like peptidoglycan-associated protein